MYIYYNPNPNSSASKKNDCVVRAISRVLNKRWTRVYDELSSLGRRLGDWGCYFTVWGPYLRDRGFKKYVIPNYCPDCYTIGEFARDNLADSAQEADPEILWDVSQMAIQLWSLGSKKSCATQRTRELRKNSVGCSTDKLQERGEATTASLLLFFGGESKWQQQSLRES